MFDSYQPVKGKLVDWVSWGFYQSCGIIGFRDSLYLPIYSLEYQSTLAESLMKIFRQIRPLQMLHWGVPPPPPSPAHMGKFNILLTLER